MPLSLCQPRFRRVLRREDLGESFESGPLAFPLLGGDQLPFAFRRQRVRPVSDTAIFRQLTKVNVSMRLIPTALSRAEGSLLPFHLTSGIIRVCLDLAGLFRNKDIRLVLMIRLARRGARKQPHYRIVVIETARARNGRPVEVVGTYNPRTNPASIELKRDRVEYWVSKGAQMSERVNKLFSKTPAPAPAGTAA
jgi:small subunit ribosomal protein S16